MSCSDVNDENRGVCFGGKQMTAMDDIFALDQPTGRPSILRQSENLPSNTVQKGMKVCFQTPQRDPLTRRILSPSKLNKMASVDERAKALGTTNLDQKNTLIPEVASDTPAPAHENVDQVVNQAVEDAPIRRRGAYSLDFDNLDAVNPFQGSSKMASSPPRPAPKDHLAPSGSQKPLDEPTKLGSSLDETLPLSASVETSLADASANVSSTDSSVVTVTKAANVEEHLPSPFKPEEEPPNPVAHQEEGSAEDTPLPPRASYTLDYDDLESINPFQTGGSKIQNSPVCAEKVDKPKSAQVPAVSNIDKPEAPKPLSVVAPITSEVGQPRCVQPELQPEPKQQAQSFPELLARSAPSVEPSEEEFVPGTTFLCSDFNQQIDYLEQFGSSTFKDSALRKQSLYLKFDPLLRESCANTFLPAHAAAPAASASCRDAVPKPSVVEASAGPKKDDFPLFDAAATMPAVNAPPLLEGLVPAFHQPASTEGDIIEVLLYSQKDMDSARAKAEEEMKENDQLWIVKYNKLSEEADVMGKLINELELHLAVVMVAQEKEKEADQAKIDKVLAEKDQLSNELNSTERSLADIVKKLEKYKDAIDSHKKNEATLKSCAQSYLADIKLEKQRYQALKAHTEEKLKHANEAVAEVKSKFRAEVAALQAQLRREQLRVKSLEQNLEQKEKEVEELHHICDEFVNAQRA